MNFLPGTVDGTSLQLPFVDVPMIPSLAAKVKGHDIVIVRHPAGALRGRVAGDDDDRGHVTFTATVDVTEWLGNEQYAYIPFEADPASSAKLDELDRDLDGEGMRTQLVVNLDCPVTDPGGRGDAAALRTRPDARLRPRTPATA